MKKDLNRQRGLSIYEILLTAFFLGVICVYVAAGYVWLKNAEKGPAPIVRELMYVAYGVDPRDVIIKVTFAEGDKHAVVRADAGAISCLVDASFVDEGGWAPLGWVATSVSCGQRMCPPDGSSSASTDCTNSSISRSVEEHIIELEKCPPDSDKECVSERS